MFVFGAKNILSRALEGCTPHGRILPNFFEKRGFNHQFEVSILFVTSKKRREKSETMTRIKPSSSSTVSAFFFFFVFLVLSSWFSFSLADDVLEEKTVLSVALNAQSPEWLTAVEAFLHDAKDEEEKEVSKIHTKPYGNPSTGSCLPNEMKVQIQGIAGR